MARERPNLELADVVRDCGPAFQAAFGERLSSTQQRALRDVARCRTAALGGHVQSCVGCGHEQIAYNSCRNRHCPKCLAGQQARWLAREAELLLPVEYHHLVFTLPAELNAVALLNPVVVYHALFQAAAETVRELAADPKHLGAQVGLLLVLHTWGQTLQFHPHLHGVVTGGGLACDRRGGIEEPSRWVSCRPGFFLPVRVLSRVFRGKFLALLRSQYGRGALKGFATDAEFQGWLQALGVKDWVVYSKPPFAGPEVVLKYLARYTHRVAIGNARLRELRDGRVRFSYKDYRHAGMTKEMTLEGVEFLRRWVQHVLPRGFVKIRHFGLLANRGREAKLAACRRLLWPRAALRGLDSERGEPPPLPCPVCGGVVWRVTADLERERSASGCGSSPGGYDSS